MKVSKALQEVWDMKAAAYEETKHLHGPAYFAYIHQHVQHLLPSGMKLRPVTGQSGASVPATKVAEASAPYRAQKKAR